MNEHVKTQLRCRWLPVSRLSASEVLLTHGGGNGGPLRAWGLHEPEIKEELTLSQSWGKWGQETREESLTWVHRSVPGKKGRGWGSSRGMKRTGTHEMSHMAELAASTELSRTDGMGGLQSDAHRRGWCQTIVDWHWSIWKWNSSLTNTRERSLRFPGGSLDRNPPANAEDMY